MPLKKRTSFKLYESNTQTKILIRIKDYSENGKDNYNSHWEYQVQIGDKTYTVFSDLYYSVWNEEEDDGEDGEKFHSYWPISIIPRPNTDTSNLIRAAVMFVYYEDGCNGQEVSDWFEDRVLLNKFDFESSRGEDGRIEDFDPELE